MEFEIREINFQTIYPIWHQHLWPGRVSEIETISCIDIEGKIDISVKQFEPKFWAAFIGDRIAGVISCHKVSSEIMRLRGIWVFPEYRNQRIGTSLINQVKIESRRQGVKAIFGLVREINQKYYRLNGFRPYKRKEGYEFGPHVIMVTN